VSQDKDVASLELCKLLVEKGTPKKAEKWWVKPETPALTIIDVFGRDGEFELILSGIFPEEWKSYPAYSISNLLGWLPVDIKDKFLHQLTIRKDDEGYYHVYYGTKIMITQIGLPAALAQMALYLLEHGYKFNGEKIERAG
jgi:hypothetical protein